MLAVRDLSPRIEALIAEQLSYDHVRYLRGREARAAGSDVEIIHTECFQLHEDRHGASPPRILCGAGWYPRIRRELLRRGYLVRYRDNTPPSRGGERVYKPLWKRLREERFRYRQLETLKAIVAHPYGQIICPTGYGKSFLIRCLAVLFPYARFVVSTHSKDVIEMLYEDLDAELPSVGLITGNRKIRDRRVMCVSGKSLHHAPRDADFLLVDEMQEFATQDYLSRLAKFQRARSYGFSANPYGDRNDKADFELEGVFGPPIIEIPYEEAVNPPDGSDPCVVQVRVLWQDVVMDVDPCEGYEDDTAIRRNGIWRNKVRNEKIAEVARRFQKEQVLIVVDTIEHACFLKKNLPEFTLVYSEEGLDPERRERFTRWGLINNDEPQMTAERRYKLKRAFERGKLRKVIATSVWNRGVNFRQLQVLIRADAKSSPVADKQIPGRLSRIAKDKPYGMLVDFYDQFSKVFENKAARRKTQYRKMKWEQIEPDNDTDNMQGMLF